MQKIGLLWIGIGLLLFSAVIFFSRRGYVEPAVVEVTDSSKSNIKHDAHIEKRVAAFQADEYKHHVSSGLHHISRKDTNSDTAKHNKSVPYVRQPLLVELNTADSVNLQLIHGIGPAYARRILRYRDRLGGFVNENQLLEVYGFTPELLEHISSNVYVDDSKIDGLKINVLPLKQLIRHPYMDYYLAADIIRLRNNGIYIGSEEDLRTIPGVTDSMIFRLSPYLIYDTL